jgi:anti-sigma B factor antagonist
MMRSDRETPDAVMHADVTDGPEIVEVVGEADRATSHHLRARLEAIAAGPEARVLVDLSFATFIDSSTLGVLAVASKRFGPCPARFAIVCPPGEVHTMFELTALDRVVPLYGTRPEALAAMEAAAPPGAPPRPAM